MTLFTNKGILLSILLIFMVPAVAWCQGGGENNKMSVADFYPDNQDMDAILEGTAVDDQNGEKCALIKIKTTQKGFSFDNGSLGVQKVDESKVAEVWVYIPKGSKRLTINNQNLGSIEYEFPTPINAARTYVMKLTTNDVRTLSFDTKHKGQLTLRIDPRVCSVVLDGSNITDVTNGEYKQKLYYGTHTYQITADRYHSLEDTVTINSNKPLNRSVQLRQAWGWLQFANAGSLADAKLFIDGEAVGNITGKAIDINSGEHRLKIVKPLYENYETEFTIKDSETNTISPNLVKNYGHVQLSVADDKAIIYVDGESTNSHIASMDLGSGEHVIECRRQSHNSTFKTITVTTGSDSKYDLDNPVPIYGTLTVSTGNVAVNVQIDDEKLTGEATNSYRNDKVLIGRHKVTISQKGYRTEVAEVTIVKDSLTEVKREMMAVVRVHFKSKPNAMLTVDSVKKGMTPVDVELRAGKHKVELYTYGYSSYSGTEKFTTDDQTFSKSLLRIFYGKNEAYIEGGGYAGSMMGYYGAIGMYIHNINFEGIYAGYLGSSETVYKTYSNGYGDELSYIGTSAYDIKPGYYVGGRLGYGIKLGGAWRLTPQVGGGVWSIDGDDGSTYVATGTAGLKLQICLCKCVSIVLKPEYTMTVSKGSDYEKLSNVSGKIKDWGQGFNISLGFNFYY